MKTILVLILGLIGQTVQAQNGITLVRTGYDDPTVIRIAPGQVVTLYAAGLKTIVPGIQRATTVPLPITLSGISVTLQQSDPASSKLIPLLSIEQFNRCDNLAPSTDCLITAVTVQIPFDMFVPNPLAAYIRTPGTTSLVISENGTMSSRFMVSPVSDQIHVLTSCDVNGQTRGSGVCFPIVTHADGSLVLQAPRGPDQQPLTNSEAKPGESIVMYLYGLGSVSPAANAGELPESPTPVTATPVYMRYDYRPNAASSKPIDFSAQPTFAGLAPKQIGLYQVNFVVPAPRPGTLSCGAAITSNLTVSVTGSTFGSPYTFDGAAICVDTRPADGQ